MMSIDTYYTLHHQPNESPLVLLEHNFGHPGSVTDTA
jgi:hypothetical protein